MNMVEEKNDLGGKSYYVSRDGSSSDPRVLAKLTAEELALFDDPNAYFRLRAAECPTESVRKLLSSLADGSLLHCEIHDARFEPALSATYFAFRLPSDIQILVGARRLPVPPAVPQWLQPFYAQLGATREERWDVAGGFHFADRFGELPSFSEYAPEPFVSPDQVAVFFSTLYGDSLGFLPDGQCVWFLHETESIVPCTDPAATVAEILQVHLSGQRVAAPESRL